MAPKITPEIRKAIDDQHGKPVYVVDADRHQTFVLLSSDDFQRVRRLLESSVDDEEWSEAKNTRRCDLIDKDIAGTITHDEQVELALLDRQAVEYFDRVAPPPPI